MQFRKPLDEGTNLLDKCLNDKENAGHPLEYCTGLFLKPLKDFKHIHVRWSHEAIF